MRKNTLSLLTVALVTTLLFGCQSEDNTALVAEKTNTEQQLDDNDKLIVDGDITKVSISKSKGVSATVFDDDEIIEMFKDIISCAFKEDGIVNMANPEFYMVVYDN